MNAITTILAASALLAGSAQAKCSHNLQAAGREEAKRMLAVVEREHAQGMSKRQAPLSLAAQRQMLDPAQECTAYYYADVATQLAEFPPIWNIAQLVPGDTEAQNAYNAIVSDPAFPNLPPKGTPLGDFTSVQYNASDPDCWWTWGECTTPKHGNGAIPNDIISCPEPDTWGLTYDDGPNCTHNAFYNYLQEQQYTATMYFIGSNVINWPFQAQRALADGHEIAMHTWSHHYSTGLTNEQFFAEMWYTRKAIKEVIGVTATAWRAPFGDVDDRIRFIATKMGLSLQLWDEDTDDWKVVGENNPGGLPTASVLNNYQQIYQHAQSGQYSTHGAIVLTHEINGHTMEIAVEELPSVAANFKHIVPVATCLNITHTSRPTTPSRLLRNLWLATTKRSATARHTRLPTRQAPPLPQPVPSHLEAAPGRGLARPARPREASVTMPLQVASSLASPLPTLRVAPSLPSRSRCCQLSSLSRRW